MHDPQYDFTKIVIDLGEFVEFTGEELDLPDGQCLYFANVYSTAENEAQVVTNEPARFAIILSCTFLFTCIVFLLYDYMVERRQKLVLDTAVRSESVVASLFPKGVRDRLYKEEKSAQKSPRSSKKAFLTSTVPAMGGDSCLEDGCKAIADLYPHCTVCFMDIVGFTQWSSGREPWQVFKLLESMYKVFDKIALRLVVFKVETIGDCYVAVTGIPHAQPDHAVIMATFASECVLRLDRILNRLVNSLGPETETLRLRVGLHSGPVTAGVLRGAKARFQLFGDTVNTAARMESTGAPSRIHLSSETAAAIVAAGKEHWVQKRNEEVMAKGKGNLQTYWLQAHLVDCSRAGSCAMGEESNSSKNQGSMLEGIDIPL